MLQAEQENRTGCRRVLDVVQDGPHDQIEPGIQAEVVESEAPSA